jgi:chromosome segregation ATPase
MPTQEERLETVEYNLRQFKTETIRAYQDMAFEMTMIKGLIEDAIKRLATLRETVEKRFDAVDQRFSAIDQRLDRLETKLDEHTSVLSEHTTRFERLETLLTQILTRLPEKP